MMKNGLENYSLIEQLLFSRVGVKTQEEAVSFLRPSISDGFHDPFLMRDMEKAVVRIFEAITGGERIVIYSDYDCDGIPGAVILSDFLRKIGSKNFSVYIPDRHEEGYGFHSHVVESTEKNGTKLIITVDVGISSGEAVFLAQSKGIDVIVTDHHTLPEELPSSFAILHPQVGEYPFPHLSGAGVAWKLVSAFLSKYREYFGVPERWEEWLLDMAGFATLSDMVPLVGENRLIAKYGISVLRKNRRPGIAKLFKKIKMDPATINEDDLTFMLTPRLNAAGRMDTPYLAYNLLVSENDKEAEELAEKLEGMNTTRKTSVAQIMKEVKKKMAERDVPSVLVIGEPDWRIGVLGLVASKIVEEYKIPVFTWGRNDDGLIKGSVRSFGGINVFNLMNLAKEEFNGFGGHSQAGGFSILEENIFTLEDKLIEKLVELENNSEREELASDSPISITLGEIDLSFAKRINAFAPFGVGNPKPIFELVDAKIIETKSFGKTGDHLMFTLGDGKGKRIKMISFFAKEKEFSQDENKTILANIEISNFMSREEVRLRLVEIK